MPKRKSKRVIFDDVRYSKSGFPIVSSRYGYIKGKKFRVGKFL